jgi:hypothetical protein
VSGTPRKTSTTTTTASTINFRNSTNSNISININITNKSTTASTTRSVTYFESKLEGFTLTSVGGLLEHEEHRAGHPEVVVHGEGD